MGRGSIGFNVRGGEPMSLTQFTERPAIKAAFQAYSAKVVLPFRPRDTPVLVESCGRRHSFLGTAFDYVARFKTGREFCMNGPPTAAVHDFGWIAEQAVAMMAQDERYASEHARWERYVQKGRELYREYLGGADISMERVVNCAQFMAAADMLVRTGEFRPDTRVDPDMTAELLALAQVFSPADTFPFERACLLNPEMGMSHLVGGADADLIVDGLLVDIKTTISPGMSSAHMRQLCGYAVLHSMGGIPLADGSLHVEPITEIGLYYSRHARLATWRIDDILPHDGFERFARACSAEMETLEFSMASPAP
jgi:hypothetical protein